MCGRNLQKPKSDHCPQVLCRRVPPRPTRNLCVALRAGFSSDAVARALYSYYCCCLNNSSSGSDITSMLTRPHQTYNPLPSHDPALSPRPTSGNAVLIIKNGQVELDHLPTTFLRWFFIPSPLSCVLVPGTTRQHAPVLSTALLKRHPTPPASQPKAIESRLRLVLLEALSSECGL